jgi:hypothetical protein
MELGYDFRGDYLDRANKKDFDLIKDWESKKSVWADVLFRLSYIKIQFHAFCNLQRYLEVTETCLKRDSSEMPFGIYYRADFAGFVIPLVKNLNALCNGYGIP